MILSDLEKRKKIINKLEIEIQRLNDFIAEEKENIEQTIYRGDFDKWYSHPVRAWASIKRALLDINRIGVEIRKGGA